MEGKSVSDGLRAMAERGLEDGGNSQFRYPGEFRRSGVQALAFGVPIASPFGFGGRELETKKKEAALGRCDACEQPPRP
jgi:hypothetical protein